MNQIKVDKEGNVLYQGETLRVPEGYKFIAMDGDGSICVYTEIPALDPMKAYFLRGMPGTYNEILWKVSNQEMPLAGWKDSLCELVPAEEDPSNKDGFNALYSLEVLLESHRDILKANSDLEKRVKQLQSQNDVLRGVVKDILATLNDSIDF